MNNRNFLKDFPTLNKERNGKRIVYLDSAATTQKPISVINSIKNYYEQSNANPHRGAYELSVLATEAYDEAREKVKKFINAKYREEIGIKSSSKRKRIIF